MFYVIISVLAGATIVTARTLNSILASKIGVYQSTFWNYVVGLIFSLIFLLASKEFLHVSEIEYAKIPIWAYTGGLIGVIVVILSNYIVMKISAFYLTLLLFVGQLLVAVIIDYVYLGQMSAGKTLGGILVFIGLAYNLMLDRKTDHEKTNIQDGKSETLKTN